MVHLRQRIRRRAHSWFCLKTKNRSSLWNERTCLLRRTVNRSTVNQVLLSFLPTRNPNPGLLLFLTTCILELATELLQRSANSMNEEQILALERTTGSPRRTVQRQPGSLVLSYHEPAPPNPGLLLFLQLASWNLQLSFTSNQRILKTKNRYSLWNEEPIILGERRTANRPRFAFSNQLPAIPDHS